jgi:DNA-binding beta-propeller fold protein YncE
VRAAGKSSANSNWDVLVAKLDPSGSRLVYSLRFGGTAGKQPPRGQIGGECGTGIAVTRDGGRAYVAGFTDSIDLPIPNATGNPGGYDDGFVAMLDDKGSLVGGAYLAGSGKDSAEGVALDSSGAVYVAGQTASNDFPISPGQPRPNPRAITTLLPAWGFVTKFQAGLTGIVYSGIVFPGTVDIADIAVDNAGWAYAAGGTAYVMVAPSGAIAGRAGLGAPIEARGVAVDTSATLHLTGYIMFGDRSLPLVRALKSDRGEASAQAFITKIDVR